MRWNKIEIYKPQVADHNSNYDLRAFASRSDGFTFWLIETPRGFWVKAGCRFFTIAQYRKHLHTYGGRLGKRKQKETRMILDLFAHVAKRPLDQ